MTGVKKIQNNQISLMNDLEHNACSRLLMSEGKLTLQSEDADEEACYDVHREIFKRRKLGKFLKQSDFLSFNLKFEEEAGMIEIMEMSISSVGWQLR